MFIANKPNLICQAIARFFGTICLFKKQKKIIILDIIPSAMCKKRLYGLYVTVMS